MTQSLRTYSVRLFICEHSIHGILHRWLIYVGPGRPGQAVNQRSQVDDGQAAACETGAAVCAMQRGHVVDWAMKGQVALGESTGASLRLPLPLELAAALGALSAFSVCPLLRFCHSLLDPRLRVLFDPAIRQEGVQV